MVQLDRYSIASRHSVAWWARGRSGVDYAEATPRFPEWNCRDRLSSCPKYASCGGWSARLGGGLSCWRLATNAIASAHDCGPATLEDLFNFYAPAHVPPPRSMLRFSTSSRHVGFSAGENIVGNFKYEPIDERVRFGACQLPEWCQSNRCAPGIHCHAREVI